MWLAMMEPILGGFDPMHMVSSYGPDPLNERVVDQTNFHKAEGPPRVSLFFFFPW